MSLVVEHEQTLPLADLRSGGDAKVRAAAATNQPTHLVEDGESVAVLISPELYRGLLDALDRLELVGALDAAEADLVAGRTVPYAEVKSMLQEWAGEDR